MQGCLCFVGMFACCASDASGEDPKPQFVLGAPVATTNPPVVGLACLLGKNEVLIQNINGLSVVDLASGKMLASAKLEPFPDSVAVRLPRHAAFSTNSGFLSVANDGKTAYSYDAMGVYSYELPLGDAPKSRVANRAKTIVPMLGIAHVGKFDFAFGVNSRGELFECRSTPGEADPRVGMVKTKLPRISLNSLHLPIPAMAGGGQYVALAGFDGRIQVWDTVAKTDLFPIGVEQNVSTLAITRDGKTLAAISFGERASGKGLRVQLFTLPDGKEIASWETTGRRLAFSPDGSVLAVVNSSKSYPKRSRIELCEPRTGKVLHDLSVANDFINCFDFTADGKLFVAGGESGTIHQWNTQTGKPKGPPATPPPGVASVAFTRDGGFNTIHWGGTVRNWNGDGQEAKTLTVHDKEAVWAIRSRDGKTIYSSGGRFDGTIRAYDSETGKELRRLDVPGRASQVIRLAESPDRKFLFAGVTGEGILRIETSSFKIVSTLKPSDPSPASAGGAANDLAFAGNSILISRDYDRLRVWSLKEESELRSEALALSMVTWGEMAPIAVSPDGRRFLTNSGLRIHVHDIGKAPLAAVIAIPNSERVVRATAMLFVTDTLIAVGDSSGKIRLVDVNKKGDESRLIGEHLGPVTCLALSPDGKRLISGSADTSAKVWTLP